jgi:hypothetical protein
MKTQTGVGLHLLVPFDEKGTLRRKTASFEFRKTTGARSPSENELVWKGENDARPFFQADTPTAVRLSQTLGRHNPIPSDHKRET